MFTSDQYDFLKGGLHRTTPGLSNDSAYSASMYSAYGASTAGVVKSSIGTVYSLRGYNGNAGMRFLQLHNIANATSLVSGLAPAYSFAVGASNASYPGEVTVGADFFGANGAAFTLGVTYAWSTGRDLYNAATGAEHNLNVNYR